MVTLLQLRASCFRQCSYLTGFVIYRLHDKVDTELAAFDRDWICDVIFDKIAARSPISKKHKGLKQGKIE